MEEYLEYSATNKCPRTTKIDRYSLSRFNNKIKPAKLFDISLSDIEKYKDLRSKEVSPVTVNIELRAIKAALNRAVKLKYLKENPAKDVRYLPVVKKIRYLDNAEIENLLKACDYLVKPVIQTFLYTGMRLGEVLNLSWDDVDFKYNVIRVRPNENWSPKNRRERVIPMHPNLVKILSGLKKQSGPVFLTMSGNRLDHTTLQEKFRAARRRAKLKEKATIHTLRHTFASHLAQNGVDLYRISKLLGHSSVKTTEIYAHLTKSNLEESLGSLDY
jgi:integrase/recombinase XerD